MIWTVASFKGGVSKTTTAIHLAAFLSDLGPTVLVDGDLNRSALGWSRRGVLPFLTVDERGAAKHVRGVEHVVIDTPARPSPEDLETLASGCDLLIVPTTADVLGLDSLLATVEGLRAVGADRYRVLLSMVPPKPSRDGDEARSMLAEAGLPILACQVRRAVAYQKAALAGSVVRDVKDPKAAECWADYQAVGRELMT